jgi:hypothetical protein
MKFSYSETWADVVRMLRENLAIVAALAGVFIFLPTLLFSYFLPPPEQMEDIRKLLDAIIEYWQANWHWFLLTQLVAMIGTLAILLLLLGTRRGTVAGLIVAALTILPFYFVASLIASIIICVGIILLIVPGFYLFGRLSVLAPVVAAEGQRNPITAISRSFEVTKGNGWAVLGFILLVAIAGSIAAKVLSWLLGIPILLVGGDEVGPFLVKVVEAAASAALSAVMIAMIAAIYRRLGARSSAAAAAD